MDKKDQENIKVYCCGVTFQHEIGHALDIEGSMPFFTDIKDLKKKFPCWKECGIVELDIALSKWVIKQNLKFKKPRRKRDESEA